LTPDAVQLDARILNSVVLRPREKPPRLWRVDYTVDTGTKKEYWESYGGVLLVTDKRLVYLEESGLFSKRYGLVTSIDHEQIQGCSVDGLVFKSLEVKLAGESATAAVYFSGGAEVNPSSLTQIRKLTPEDMQAFLNQVIANRLHEREEERKMERVQYVLDFSFLRAEMEKGGIVVQNIRCPSCNADVWLPATGTNMKCQYCNSVIYARDVFDKMKGLIGAL